MQQDGAPSHPARNTISYPQSEKVTFIEPVVPANSPHLNQTAYAVVGSPAAAS